MNKANLKIKPKKVPTISYKGREYQTIQGMMLSDLNLELIEKNKRTFDRNIDSSDDEITLKECAKLTKVLDINICIELAKEFRDYPTADKLSQNFFANIHQYLSILKATIQNSEREKYGRINTY